MIGSRACEMVVESVQVRAQLLARRPSGKGEGGEGEERRDSD